MTVTLDDMTRKGKREPTAEERAAEEMVRRAPEQGLSLTGSGGLLQQLNKTVLTESTGEVHIEVPRDRVRGSTTMSERSFLCYISYGVVREARVCFDCQRRHRRA